MASHNRNLVRNSFSRHGGEYDYLFKLLLLGDAGVGKSSLLLRWSGDQYLKSYIATIGIDFRIKTIEVGGKKVRLQVWDTAGQDRFRSITAQYYRNTDGILCVFDLTNEESFRKIPVWYKDIQDHKTNDAELILVGNKSDLASKIVISTEEAEAMAEQYDMDYVETSCKTAVNVDACFERLVRKVLSTETKNNTRKLSDSIDLTRGRNKPTSSTKCAC